MLMAILIKTVMSGLLAASALAVIGASASVALTSRNLAARPPLPFHETQAIAHAEALDQNLHQAVWSMDDQEAFWKEQEDRGG
jgi:hypothetical protein